MDRLAFGPVGTYFSHRWSDPTFLSGLALAEAHWTAPLHAFELACRIGHPLLDLARHGVAVTGAVLTVGVVARFVLLVLCPGVVAGRAWCGCWWSGGACRTRR